MRIETKKFLLVIMTLSTLALARASALEGGPAHFVSLEGANLDGNNPKFVKDFSLPEIVKMEGKAFLLMRVGKVSAKYNHVYLNPPTNSCWEAGANDQNAPGRILAIAPTDQYDAGHGVPLYHAFDASKLQKGKNRFMVCARDKNGKLAGNIDAFSIRDIMLIFHTQW